MGFSDISLYGAEGSYELAGTHAYQDAPEARWMRVSVGGALYVTKAELLLQGVYTAAILREFPAYFHDRSGGLLGALVKDSEWQVDAVSPAMAATMRYGEHIPVCQSPW